MTLRRETSTFDGKGSSRWLVWLDIRHSGKHRIANADVKALVNTASEWSTGPDPLGLGSHPARRRAELSDHQSLTRRRSPPGPARSSRHRRLCADAQSGHLATTAHGLCRRPSPADPMGRRVQRHGCRSSSAADRENPTTEVNRAHGQSQVPRYTSCRRHVCRCKALSAADRGICRSRPSARRSPATAGSLTSIGRKPQSPGVDLRFLGRRQRPTATLATADSSASRQAVEGQMRSG